MVLNEYLSRFSVMIESARKVDAGEKLALISIVSIPHMKKADSNKIIRHYQEVLTGGVIARENQA
jgi:hypothetical protein